MIIPAQISRNTLAEVEEEIFKREGIRVVFRAEANKVRHMSYPYLRALGKNLSMAVLHDRIRSYNADLEYVVIDGRGKIIYDTDIAIGVVRSSYR